jgi:8-hydroxy-5-deazaflavin:NADPH oxidoreductase
MPPAAPRRAQRQPGRADPTRLPNARVVKSLHTVFAQVMVDPAKVPGQHSIFVGGDDKAAKETVKGLVREFGWAEDAIIDLGGTWLVNIAVVRAS